MYTRKHYLLAILLAGAALLASGQSRKDLEEKRKELLREISQTETQLQSTQQDKKQVLSRYIFLQNQIRNRERLISTLRTELEFTERRILRTGEVIQSLQKDIALLQDEYARTLRTAYRIRLNRSLLIFLFSANSLNEAIRRWQYIRQYERYRSHQAALIAETQETLASKIVSLELQKEQKTSLLGTQEQQKALLAGELKEKNELLRGLRADEKQLAAQLQKQREAEKELSATIAAVIRREMEAKSKSGEAVALNAALVRLSEEFADNRGVLPWPVAQGTISRRYGTQEHPKLKGVKVTNNGIDIRTRPEAEVFSIFPGKVVSNSYIPGYRHTIIIQHGLFYTVYSNLDRVEVERGQELKGGQLIGMVSRSEPEVHFELWEEKSRRNPQSWIRNR